ncbi:beta-hexosaminidase [Nannizzia gypsea CBS 118893]|uniref:Beta-hexosaminidase n=1 Tax=Arthroderma gypseum (strain ATCC MYA-4604 / CBS 118893) TaxID=535722 RepID=E4UVK6_ARTGP|nr:beta-hexosaminidase [Nannizzia gypsea CBS 118893]EFR02333.1 beta-hexosaminidase [Nannizzia gypsea CBS 118893]
MSEEEIRRKLGQLFIVGFDGLTANEGIKSLIKAPFYIGNVILFRRNVGDAEQLITLTSELQRTARDAGHTRPLFIAIDQENGWVSQIKPPIAAQLPGSMALGATGSTEDAIRVARATGELLYALGINMNYAPVCDVNSEPANPVIGVRSPGDDGVSVGRIASAFAKGLREEKVVPCVKHFPGHGDTMVDSHYGLPVVNRSIEELEACELIPFRRTTAENVESVMTSHIVLPALEESNLPMTLSKSCVQFLRERLQYDGLLVSDCLEMEAIRAHYGSEKGAAMAIAAGVDCAMVCHTLKAQMGAYNEVYEAFKHGVITSEGVAKSVARVTALKDRFVSWELVSSKRTPELLAELRLAHEKLAADVYARSVTLVRDTQNAIPIKPDQKVVYAYFALVGGFSGVPHTVPYLQSQFGKMIMEHHSNMVECPIRQDTSLEEDEEAKAKISDADVVILVTKDAKMSGSQVELTRLIERLSKKLIVVAMSVPYDFLEDKELVKTYLTIYEPTPEAFLPAVKIILGDLKPKGKLPVSAKLRQIPIEPFNAGRDLARVIKLWHQLLPRYAVPSATLSHVLTRPNGAHLVSRFEDEIVGFVATYVNEDRPTTFIPVVLVDSGHQGKGVGTAMIEHARIYLRKRYPTSSVTIGSSFPRFWPGVPTDISKQAQDFFIHRGFCPERRPSARDYTADLLSYEAPKGILERAEKAGVIFAPWSKEKYGQCMEKQRKLFGKDAVWMGAYEGLAQTGRYDQVMVATDSSTGEQIGWTLMQELGIGMTQELAMQPLVGIKSGQIGCVGVAPEARNKGVGLALITHAALDLKRRGMEHVFIDWSNHVNWYERAGFKVWGEYRTMVLHELAK